MTGLFSSFDLKPLIFLNLIMIVLMGSFWLKAYWTQQSRVEYALSLLFNSFMGSLSGAWVKGSMVLFSSLFLSILWFNWMGLFSYIFTNTSMIAFTFSTSSFIWMSLMIMTLSSNLTNFLSHLVPNGTPVLLISFMTFIELVSNMIRPLTLGVRLAANITAGHLLMALLAFMDSWVVSISLQVLLFILEIAVGLIQAYVFALLSFLYFVES